MKDTSSSSIKRSLVVVMAVATGVTVANNYYAQSLLPSIGKTFHLSTGFTGFLVTVSQLGYVIGLLFLVSLGDFFERRRLITTLTFLTACGLALMAVAPSWELLYPATFLVGVVSTATQIVVPFAATLSSEEERGRVVGAVMSGLLIGLLAARTFAGALAETGSWRTVYFVATALMLVLTLVLREMLPKSKEHSDLTYGQLLKSVAMLFVEERALRIRSFYGMLSFACFSVLWTSISFLLRSEYHYSDIVIGLFGLVGIAGALTASFAGRASDKGMTKKATVIAAVLLTASWLAIWGGGHSVWWLIVGVAALDAGVQGMHVTNQGVIYNLPGSRRSRLNSGYMVCYFVGGVIGSAISAWCYEVDGWDGVCLVGVGIGALSLLTWFLQNFAGRELQTAA
jgi:predicted MFS family arabinose efflux permease